MTGCGRRMGYSVPVYGGLALSLLGCSLGDAHTVTCDPTGGENGCLVVAACDNGDGTIKPTADCCKLRGSDEYGIRCQQQLAAGTDFRALCEPGGTGEAACCEAAQNIFDLCMTPPEPDPS